jgi:excisionase family DNA binding protein
MRRSVQDMHSPREAVSQHLLTARQVQLMLGVDRSTVYRMAEDGRIPAIKVGRQWRFPADRIGDLLRVVEGTPPAPPVSHSPAPAAPSPVVAASVAEVAADLLGVMMVVTDMDGHPITGVSNPCPWFTERSDDPGLIDACITEWQQLADDPDFEPRFAIGTLGFECARSFIRSGTSLVGMVLVGGIAPVGSDVSGLHHLDGEGRRRVLSALPRVAAVLSQVSPRITDTSDGRNTP